MGCVFFVKQKTAYEMRISDWSSDVCSSDLYLREETSHAAIESLRQGHVDCVLLALPFACGDVDSEMLFKDPLFVAFPKDDPRDPPAHILPEAIDETRLLLLEDGHCLKDHAL